MHLDTHLLLEPLPPPAHRLDLEKPRNAQIPRVPADGWCACACACACENFVPSGFRLSCLSTPSVNITAGGRGGFSSDSETCIFPSINIGQHTTNAPSMQYYCNSPPSPHPAPSLSNCSSVSLTALPSLSVPYIPVFVLT